MNISGAISDSAALGELGSRIARHRLNRNLTQAMLAAEAGVSRPTVQRIERGESTQMSNFIRILRALKLLENLDAMIPMPAASPVQQVRMRGRVRQRASTPSAKDKQPSEWTWGEES